MTKSTEEKHLSYEDDLVAKSHPEIAAGGYPHGDGTVEFYQRVMAVLPEGATILDLGAGRGLQFEANGGAWKHWLVRLGKKYSRRIGVDVDTAVKANPELDQAEIIEQGEPLPFPNQTFDLILCDWVVEHIADPESFVAEVQRVLKIDGWFCARTPNRWSYFAVGARILSARMEARILRVLAPRRHAEDVFPKFYRLNTLSDIAKQFKPGHWINASYTHNIIPGYHANMRWLSHLISFYQWLTPRSLGTIILIFARRIA